MVGVEKGEVAEGVEMVAGGGVEAEEEVGRESVGAMTVVVMVVARY